MCTPPLWPVLLRRSHVVGSVGQIVGGQATFDEPLSVGS